MPPKRKVIYVISNINKAISFEWVALSSIAKDFDLSFVLLNPGASLLEEHLKAMGVPVLRISYRGKKDLPGATFKLLRHFQKVRPDVVHTHLVDASLAGLVAAKMAGVPTRFHTRHHANMHHLNYRHAVVYDRLINTLSTRIVATCKNVQRVLVELDQVRPEKVTVIHFGFDLNAFDSVDAQRVAALRQKYSLGDKRPVVGVIARYMEYKGLQHVIPAFERLLKHYPEACLFMANTSGKEYAHVVAALLARLPKGSYREVPFEEDFAALYKLFDVFVHAPVDAMREAFGQIYVEALAAGRPSVFTLSGVASEFIKNEGNALVVSYSSPDEIHDAVVRILEDPALAAKLAQRGKADVNEIFPLAPMLAKLGRLYGGRS